MEIPQLSRQLLSRLSAKYYGSNSVEVAAVDVTHTTEENNVNREHMKDSVHHSLTSVDGEGNDNNNNSLKIEASGGNDKRGANRKRAKGKTKQRKKRKTTGRDR